MNYPNSDLLIEPGDLAALGSAVGLRILDATVFLVPAERGYRAESGLERYRTAHIPGAAFMDLIRAFSDTTTGLGFSLPAPAALGAAIGSIGIDSSSRIVVYSSGHLMWATRAFWLLRHAGLSHVQVLNGGLAGWQALGLPTVSGDEHYPPAMFTPTVRHGHFTDLAGMRAALDNPQVCTVNALSPEVYAGTGDISYGRRGHIPGSRNLHYDQLLDGQRFAAPERLQAALDATGMLTAPRVIAYCGGGISATIDAFACLLMGKDTVTVYDGSMAEWARDPALPLTVGDQP